MYNFTDGSICGTNRDTVPVILNTRMLDQEVAGVHTALTASDWAARVTGLQTLRGLVTASAGCKEQLLARLGLLEPGLEAAVADLRSQVVREACVTVAFIAQQHQYQVVPQID